MPQSKLIGLLSEAEQQRLSPYLEEVQLRQNQELLEAGGPIHHVWFTHDCVTSTIVDSTEGTTIGVGLMGYEGMVGFSAVLGKTASNTTVIVQLPRTATRMSYSDFRRYGIDDRSELVDVVLQYVDAFVAMVAQTAASSLQQVGLLQYSRGHVTIVDRKGIEDRACACYEIVRTISEGMFAKDARRRAQRFVRPAPSRSLNRCLDIRWIAESQDHVCGLVSIECHDVAPKGIPTARNVSRNL